MSTELRTPEDLSTERQNELICEKLLGWIRHNYPANDLPAWEVPSKAGEFQPTVFVTPSFTTWAEAGLILEALKTQRLDRLELSVDDEGEWRLIVEWDRHEKHRSRYSNDGPRAVRKGALSYIEARQL